MDISSEQVELLRREVRLEMEERVVTGLWKAFIAIRIAGTSWWKEKGSWDRSPRHLHLDKESHGGEHGEGSVTKPNEGPVS